MSTFHLQIVTPDTTVFDGEAVRAVVRTIDGDVGFMKGHSDYMSALNGGSVKLTLETGDVKMRTCGDGVVCVKDGKVLVLCDKCELK